ncbi:MAG: right-handed parallel beta-helix repeat-containing protein [Phycisphaerae bacterium]
MTGGRVLTRIEPRTVIAVAALLLAAGEVDGLGGPCDLNEQTRLTAADAVSAPRVWFVDDDGDTDACCTSWADSCPDLQTALSFAGPGDEIWVAAGIYMPAGPDGDRAATFQLTGGVAVYGGFAGNETTLDERAGLFDETILTGDLNGDDVPVADPTDLLFEPTRSDNSFHVVTVGGVDATPVLDGFTITAGQAGMSSFPDLRGGGMLNDGGSPTVMDCVFDSNAAHPFNSSLFGGGGMLNTNDSHPTVTNCIFTTNAAFRGGGMSNDTASVPTVTRCAFIENTATIGGGGMFNGNESPSIVTNCAFTGNESGAGGGVLNGRCSPTLAHCVFSGNSASRGGAVYNSIFSDTAVSDCTFSGNAAEWFGGAMYNDFLSIPRVTDCVFIANAAGAGGGMFNSRSNAVVTHCAFSGNTANAGNVAMPQGQDRNVTTHTLTQDALNFGSGGGMFNENSDPVLTNCTFKGNQAPLIGGGMRNAFSSPTLTNCTFSGNLADSVRSRRLASIRGRPRHAGLSAEPGGLRRAAGGGHGGLRVRL